MAETLGIAVMSELAKKLLYASGLLAIFHRLRNRRTLTVIMFHRVLDPTDPRWASCDPDYTLDVSLLDQCLQFFGRHYNIVSVEQVLASRRSGTALPPRALLVTFDDGWSDNLDFALPRLRAAGVPGLLFVVADVIGRQFAFYQERIVGAWRLGKLRANELALAAGDADRAKGNSLGELRHAIAGIESLDETARELALHRFEHVLDDGLRHMLNRDELRTLESGNIAIGLHGKTHTPMTLATDLNAELSGARQEVAAYLERGEPPVTMSFPHGRHDAKIANQAHEAGYELIFTSEPILNPTDPKPGWLLGRVGFEQDGIVDASGRFSAEKLALLLFRKKIAVSRFQQST